MTPDVIQIREQITPRLAFLVEYLNLQEATNDPDAKWERFQIHQLNNDGPFDIWLKSRQVGFSWTSAAEAVAVGCLEKRSTIIFVSINQNEAKEKIRYAHHVIEGLDKEVRPKLITENAQEIEFENGSRIISHPATPVRGKAKAWVYLDEFAHVPKDRLIYEAAVPVTTRGGRIRIGSSPLGESGVFWEIFSQKIQKYPGYRRFRIPWWHVQALTVNMERAKVEAPLMSTTEAVEAFGTPRLKVIFEAMPLESFEQEYCCFWVDESVSWITWEEIRRNQLWASEGKLEYMMVEGMDNAMTAIEWLAHRHQKGLLHGPFYAGYDVGRRRNLSELIVLGPGGNLWPYRLGITLDRVEFSDQKRMLEKVLTSLPIRKMNIDETGLGMQLVEDLAKTYPIVNGMTFSREKKEHWAVNLKVNLQNSQIPLPIDRDLAYQIHSVKKKVTDSNNVIFDVDESEKHHADKFWALALAAIDATGSSVSRVWVV